MYSAADDIPSLFDKRRGSALDQQRALVVQEPVGSTHDQLGFEQVQLLGGVFILAGAVTASLVHACPSTVPKNVGAPPIRTDQGWLSIYHGVFHTMDGSVYRLGWVAEVLSRNQR